MSDKQKAVMKLRCLLVALARLHGVNPKKVTLTRVPFFNFMAFILAKYPKESICSIGSKAGKCWQKMSCKQRQPYIDLANLVCATGVRK